MLALILSALFPAFDKQFIAAGLIIGLKWVVADKHNKVNIIIKEGGPINTDLG